MAEPEAGSGAESSFISHLIELRNRLLYALASVGLVFLALVPFSAEVYTLLAKPLMDVLPAGASMIATDVASPFLTPIRLTPRVGCQSDAPHRHPRGAPVQRPQ